MITTRYKMMICILYLNNFRDFEKTIVTEFFIITSSRSDYKR